MDDAVFKLDVAEPGTDRAVLHSKQNTIRTSENGYFHFRATVSSDDGLYG